MKKTQLNDIKKTDSKELVQKVKELRVQLQSLVLDKSVGKMTNLKQIFFKRKDLAQVLTVLNQKQLLEKMKGDNAHG